MQTAHHASEDLKQSASIKTKHPQVQAFERWRVDSFAGPAKLQLQLSETLYLAFCAGIEYSARMRNDLADSLGDMLALFDDEGNFREEYQDQASVAIERAESNLANQAGRTQQP